MNSNMGFRTKNGCDWLFMTNLLHYERGLIEKKSFSPTPGIEPGPPGWKPGILAIRPRGMSL